MLASFSLWAATETSTNTGTSDAAVAGTSYTIPGTYIAGKGGTQVTPMPNKGLKVRLNKTVGETENAFAINVNEGYKITALTFTGVTNTDNKAATIGSIVIDGAAWDGLVDNSLPAKNASAAASIAITGINSTQSIVFVFSDLNGASQANICLEVTYEVTATTYVATYKANYGEVADVVDNAALKVQDNMFEAPEDSYFVGWNTAADGTGEDVAVGTALSANITLFAQWKTFPAACISLELSGEDQTPAKNVEVLLTAASEGGKIFFAGAKDNKFGDSFVPKENKGIQLSKGAADSLRVELNKYLAVGSIIRIDLIAVNDGAPAINLVPAGKSAIALTGAVAAKEDTKSVYYEVVADDGLAGANIFWLQRNGSVILNKVAVANCGADIPTAIDNTEVNTTAVKVIRNGQLFIEKNGVLYNAQGAVVK